MQARYNVAIAQLLESCMLTELARVDTCQERCIHQDPVARMHSLLTEDVTYVDVVHRRWDDRSLSAHPGG